MPVACELSSPTIRNPKSPDRPIGVIPNPLKCLVTGATGMIGRHLVDVLVESGVAVRAYARPSSDTRRLAGQGVEVVRADRMSGETADTAAMRRIAAMRRALAGVDVVFFAAGYLTAEAPFRAADDSPGADWSLYQAVNVDLTEAFLQACLETGVDRFLYISSSSVYAPGALVPTLEDAPLRPASAYGRSKLLAEEAVRAAQGQGLATTIVRPALTYGPGDRYFTPLALRLARLPLLPLVNGGRALLDLVYARDVAELMWRAALRPEAAGRVYNAGPGRPTSLRDLVVAYRRLTGKGPIIIPVSPAVSRLTARLSHRLVGPLLPEARAALSPQGLALMNRDIHLSMERASVELDFRPRYDLLNGLKETLIEFGV
jgi:nucleoside-diphosphate-sugar epimerase